MTFLKRIFYLPSCRMFKFFSTKVQPSTSLSFKEQKIIAKNYEINYLRVGHGPHHVFCAGGMMTTIWSSFEKQIKSFDYEKFSLIIWDPPGNGQSIALNDKEPRIICSSDADIAYEFMKALKIPKYSLLGWSNGGTVCLLLASRYPDVVNKVVAWGCSSFMLPNEIEYYRNMKNFNTWTPQMKDEMIKVYGEENYVRQVNDLIDTVLAYYDSKMTFCDEIKRIKCPTFLLYGAKDRVVDSWHLNYLKNLIANSRTYEYPEGKHNIHMKYADDFNKKVQEFLLS